MISEAAYLCGDPGLQFHTTINAWHTCPNTGLINASNPCSEFMFLDDSACNLASINLMKFVDDQAEFDADAFRAAVSLVVETDYDGGQNDRQRYVERIMERMLTKFEDPTTRIATDDIEYLMAKLQQLAA